MTALPRFHADMFENIIRGVVSPIGYSIGKSWPTTPAIIGSVLLAVGLIIATRKSNDTATVAAVIGGASILCSPYALLHDCLALIPFVAGMLLRDRPSILQFPAILLFAALATPIALPLTLAALAWSIRDSSDAAAPASKT